MDQGLDEEKIRIAIETGEPVLLAPIVRHPGDEDEEEEEEDDDADEIQDPGEWSAEKRFNVGNDPAL